MSINGINRFRFGISNRIILVSLKFWTLKSFYPQSWSTFLSNFAEVKKYLQFSSCARFTTASSLNFLWFDSKSHLFAAITIGISPWPSSFVNFSCEKNYKYLHVFYERPCGIYEFLVKMIHRQRNKLKWIHHRIYSTLREKQKTHPAQQYPKLKVYTLRHQRHVF